MPRRRKPTARETELEATIARLQLIQCAAVWMLRNGQPFTPNTWMSVFGPRTARILVRTNDDGFPSSAWHDSELTREVRSHLLVSLSDGGKDDEFSECSKAIDTVLYSEREVSSASAVR